MANEVTGWEERAERRRFILFFLLSYVALC